MLSASNAYDSKVIKLNNSMSYHGNKRNLIGIPRFIQVEIIGALNGPKSA